MLRARRLCLPYLGTDSVQATLILLGGVWAMVPDVYWITSGYTEPIQAIHDTALANLFWFHRTLDVLDLRDTSIGGYTGCRTVDLLYDHRRSGRHAPETMGGTKARGQYPALASK